MQAEQKIALTRFSRHFVRRKELSNVVELNMHQKYIHGTSFLVTFIYLRCIRRHFKRHRPGDAESRAARREPEVRSVLKEKENHLTP